MRGPHLKFAWLSLLPWVITVFVINLLGLLSLISFLMGWLWIIIISFCALPALFFTFHFAGILDEPPEGWTKSRTSTQD